MTEHKWEAGRIYGPGEYTELQVVDDVDLGWASLMSFETGEVEQLPVVRVEHSSIGTAQNVTTLFALTPDQFWRLICTVRSLHLPGDDA